MSAAGLERTSSRWCPLSPSIEPGALGTLALLWLPLVLSFFLLGSHPVTFTSVISFRFENGGEFTAELEDGDDPAAYVTNLSYYHLVPFETDILD